MSQASFILNQRLMASEGPAGLALVDVIRNHAGLKGTTVACREGDCGACTVIVGEATAQGGVSYRTITSCISPLLNASGKHIVTIEGLSDGLASSGLNPIQTMIMQHAGTQCGFCTPGFIVSLAGYLLNAASPEYEGARQAMDGNICRCTGYKSIERATQALIAQINEQCGGRPLSVNLLIELGLLPAYFASIPSQLQTLRSRLAKDQATLILAKKGRGSKVKGTSCPVGGGTDLWVQRPDELRRAELRPVQASGDPYRGISVDGDHLVIGGASCIEDLKQSSLLKRFIPRLDSFLQLFASTQIRQQATVAGNIVNASPIGDLSNFLLALDANLVLEHGKKRRQVRLRDFYTGYKQKDLRADELVAQVRMPLPEATSFINLEKVSRRKYLDIAAVTTSMHVKWDGQKVTHAAFSAGGVAPFPLYLQAMPAYLVGKPLRGDHVQTAVGLAQQEVSPISDGRGSAAYKRLLLRQLLYAHFISCFPEQFTQEALGL